MAGTPDRSKQQESSGGPTSEERDPRLAMARQSPERVDQATAVFSVRDVPGAGAVADASGAQDADADPAPGSASTSASASDSGADAEPEAGSADGTAPGSGDEPGDARLRAAVAAWVGAPRDGSADEPDEPETAGTDASGAESPSEGDSAPDAGEPERDEPEAADAAAEGDGADSGADSSADSGDDEAGAPEDSADAEATDAPEESGDDADSADARAAAAEDAEPSDEDEQSSSGDAKLSDEDEQSSSGDAKLSDEAKSSDDAKADAEPADEAKTPSGETKPADETKAEAKPTDDAKAPADAKPTDDEPSAETKPADETKAEAKPTDDAKAPADAKPTDDAKADAEPTGDDAKPDDAKPAKDAQPSDGAQSSDDAKASTPAVDQATAVFKAVKPPVDQPTQMLKSLGSKPAGAGKAESDAERTSKFVPLRLDSGAPAKPKAQPGAQSGAQPGAQPEAEPTAAPQAKPYVGPERTSQQPLPPLPPLDLLAELTNTPPPAETRVRTTVRRVKIWTPLVLLLAVVFAVVQAVRPLPAPTLALTAKSTFTFDGDKVSLPWPAEGQGSMDASGIGSMDQFGEQKPVPIGSVAKAMTAYVVLKDHPLQAGKNGPSIDVDAKAETEGGYDSEGESTLNTVKEGDKLSQKDALAAIMIPSANNIARLLARWDAGSEEAFVKKMNAAAKDLGMTGTTYTDPSGLKGTTVSTAQDQVKLGNELVKIQALMDITKLPTWTDPSGKTWQNYNRLVPYNNAIGVKTGSTTKAGGNLLFAATKDAGGETVTVVGAILGQHKVPIIDTVNAVSKTAMLAAQDAVKASTILKKGDVVGYVDDGLGGHTPVVVTKNVSAVGWAGLTVKLELADGAKGAVIPHSAKAGTKVGELKVGDGSGGAVAVPVALQKDLAEPGFSAKLTRVG
ncbi:D-alanyl-D-alanine carboxypeptidase [Streptomyces sp. NPDC048156]|uniref:D-alanyl-D-alanine carboxypeptidase n=1 Tax=Streptomyces sp. NPDC048156 TaxID=3365502 RepID=UPI00371AEE0A